MLLELEVGKVRKAVFTQTSQRNFIFTKWTNLIGDNAVGKSAMLKMIGNRSSYDSIIYDGTYYLTDTGKTPIKFRLRFDKPTTIVKYDPRELLDRKSLSDGWFWGSIPTEEMVAVQMADLCGGELQSRYFNYFLKKNYDILHNEQIDKIILFDELETSLSLKSQEVLFRTWSTYSAQPHIQIIMATHSPLAMTHGSCIELTPGYRKYYGNRLLELASELLR